jgi:hypothetical protein
MRHHLSFPQDIVKDRLLIITLVTRSTIEFCPMDACAMLDNCDDVLPEIINIEISKLGKDRTLLDEQITSHCVSEDPNSFVDVLLIRDHFEDKSMQHCRPETRSIDRYILVWFFVNEH